MSIIKKIFKTIGIILLVIVILLLLAVAGLSINHCIKLSKNKEFLQEKGCCDLVSVGDHSLNLVKYGGAEDKHRIVALAGNGAGFPVELQTLADGLLEESAVYYLARAGYDGSDDVKQDMTAEFIVEDYRKALQNAGVEAPYILMPHSYAGVLATYWVSKYPDEIEAMICLDGMVAQSFTDAQLQEAEQEAGAAGVLTTMMKIGLGDAAPRMFIEEFPEFSEDEQRVYDAMSVMTMSSNAFASDLQCTVANNNDTWNMMQPNNVPKLYINAQNGYQSAKELEEADVLSEYRINFLTQDFEGSEEERRAKAYELEWEELETYKKEKMQPYFEKLGNCKVVDLPGGHFIHLEQPEKCAKIITDFIARLG